MVIVYKVIRDFQKQLKRQNISAHAASSAFFFFLSFVPMVILAVSIIPYTPLNKDILYHFLQELLPEHFGALLEPFLNHIYDKSVSIISIAALVAIWSAGKGLLAFMRGLNDINNVEEKRNYFVLRIMASFYTLIFVTAILISLIIMVFGQNILRLMIRFVPQLQYIVEFFMTFRFLAVMIILALFFTTIYTYIPNKKLKFSEQLLGGLFSAVIWNIFSWGFSKYAHYADYSIYGSLSMIVLAMLWMYCCMYILLIGAYINIYFRYIGQLIFRFPRKRVEKKKH